MRMNPTRDTCFPQRDTAAVRPRPAPRGEGGERGPLLVLLALFAFPAIARAADRPLPKLVQKDGRHALDGRRRAVSRAGCAGEQLQRVAGRAAAGVAGDQGHQRQHRRDARLLGAVRAQARRLRLHGRRRAHHPVAQERRPADLAVVRDVEERRASLHAAVDEAGAREVPADARRERAHGGLGVAVLARDAGSGQACVRRADAPPQEVRRAAHGDHGAGRERARHLGRDPRLLAGGDEGVRKPGAGARARRDEQEACQPDRRLEGRVRQGRGRISFTRGPWPRSSARSPRRARRSTRCRCTRTPRSAIRSRRGRPAATRAAAPPTTCCRSGRPLRPRSTSWRPTST